MLIESPDSATTVSVASDEETAAPEPQADPVEPSSDPQDTGIHVILRPDAPPGRRRADRVHLGFLSVPAGPFSCAASVAIHAAALGIALLAARCYFTAPRLAADWGGSGGGDVTLAGDASPAPPQSRLPNDASSPIEPPAEAVKQSIESRTDAQTDAMPFATARATQLEGPAGDDRAGGPDPLIGLSVQVAGAASPVFRRSGSPAMPAPPQGGAPAGEGRTASGSVGSPTSLGGGVTSHAGLPGALRGNGIPAPEYPPDARRRGQQGIVKVAVEVLPDGHVGEIRVVSDPGYPLLREAAMAATAQLRRFPFTPAYRWGQPVRDYVIIPYRFILQ